MRTTTLIDQLLVAVLGSPCPACGQDAPSYQFCAGCRREWLTAVPTCHRCGTALKRGVSCCSPTVKQHISELVFVSDFTGPHAALIKLLKYHGDLTLVEPFAHLLAIRLQERRIKPDVLVPMPMHISRLRSRGYNQAYLLAQALGRIMKIPCKPLLKRRHPTEALEGLSRRARERVVANSMAATGPVKGICAVIDDVYTTGASAEQAAAALNQAGADRALCAVLGRTPLNGDNHHTWMNRAFHDTRAAASPRGSR